MRGSTDFLSYYMKMETFFGQIWIAEAKALSLLKMARQWPRMHFAEADDTIDKYQSYLVSQEKAFEKVIGPHVMVLVEAVRKNPGGLVLVNFQTYDKSWPHPRSDPDLGVHVLGVGNRKDIKEHPWALKLSCPIEEPTPEGSYPFELVSLEPSDPDCPLVSAPCLSPCIMVPGNSKASWLIKPLENGKFSFSFYSLSMDLDALPSTMGLGKFYEKSNGLYLDLGPEDSILCGRDFDAEKVDSSEGCGFFLTPK
nr:uncharacterized protein CTRU02_02933 [Colletotrichum truncatum]KAF6797891.1 hypothetical protein CTRU02_02933 [Colletotrichum truncatum]